MEAGAATPIWDPKGIYARTGPLIGIWRGVWSRDIFEDSYPGLTTDTHPTTTVVVVIDHIL